MNLSGQLVLDGTETAARAVTAAMFEGKGSEVVYGWESTDDLLMVRYAFDRPNGETLVLELRAIAKGQSPLEIGPGDASEIVRTMRATVFSKNGSSVHVLPVEECELAADEYTIRVALATGFVDLILQRYWAWFGEQTRFASALGSLDGVEFEQQDFAKLLYVFMDHTQLDGSFLVMFDKPIGSACGVAIEQVGLSGSSDLAPSAYFVDCDLNRQIDLSIAEVTVSAD